MISLKTRAELERRSAADSPNAADARTKTRKAVFVTMQLYRENRSERGAGLGRFITVETATHPDGSLLA